MALSMSSTGTARRRSACPMCTAAIEPGAAIARHGQKWAHASCVAAAAGPDGDGAGTAAGTAAAALADSAAANGTAVCRHWTEYGSCAYGERCAFAHPPDQRRATQVVIGLGTGRCGTLSLSLLLNRQPNAKVRHEPEIDQDFFRWDADLDLRRTCVARHYEVLRGWHRPLVGAVHYAYLPYAEEYIAQDPTVKLVVLERPREEVVRSWLRFTVGTNHWQPSPLRPQNRWERSFPSYP
jgi:hypothetical protein